MPLLYFRLDADQCVRRNIQNLLHIKDKDYYEFEGNTSLLALISLWLVIDIKTYLSILFALIILAHIFFDNTMENKKQANGKTERVVNDWVRLLVSVVDEAAR